MCQPLTGLARSDHQNWRRLRCTSRGNGRSQVGQKPGGGQHDAVGVRKRGEQVDVGIGHQEIVRRE